MIPQVPLFEQRCNATFSASKRIFKERGTSYGDTWRHCQHLVLKAAIKKIFDIEATNLQCQVIASGVLVDVKYQRFEGGWNADNAHDGINYEAFHADAMRELSNPNGHDQTYM